MDNCYGKMLGYLDHNGLLLRQKVYKHVGNYRGNPISKLHLLNECVLKRPDAFGWEDQCLVTKMRYCANYYTLLVRNLLCYYINTLKFFLSEAGRRCRSMLSLSYHFKIIYEIENKYDHTLIRVFVN